MGFKNNIVLGFNKKIINKQNRACVHMQVNMNYQMLTLIFKAFFWISR